MALTDEGNSGIPATMLVSPSNMVGGGYPYPVYQNGGGNNNGFGDGQGWWIVLLIIAHIYLWCGGAFYDSKVMKAQALCRAHLGRLTIQAQLQGVAALEQAH